MPPDAKPEPRRGPRAPPHTGVEWEARAQSRVPHTEVHQFARRYLEPAQDILVVALAVALFALMVRILAELAGDAVAPDTTVRGVRGQVLFMLVLIELLRLLIIYLRDQHLSVDVMVEVTIVGALREVLLLGVVEIDPLRLLAITAFLLALGLLLRFGDLRIGQRTQRMERHPAPAPIDARAPAAD